MKLPNAIVGAALKANAAHLDMLPVEACASLTLHRGDALTLRQRSDLNLARIRAGQLRQDFVDVVLAEALRNGR